MPFLLNLWDLPSYINTSRRFCKELFQQEHTFLFFRSRACEPQRDTQKSGFFPVGQLVTFVTHFGDMMEKIMLDDPRKVRMDQNFTKIHSLEVPHSFQQSYVMWFFLSYLKVSTGLSFQIPNQIPYSIINTLPQKCFIGIYLGFEPP